LLVGVHFVVAMQRNATTVLSKEEIIFKQPSHQDSDVLKFLWRKLTRF